VISCLYFLKFSCKRNKFKKVSITLEPKRYNPSFWQEAII